MTARRQSIYLAGAMAPNGWRHFLVQGYSDDPVSNAEFPILSSAVFGIFDFVGPFPFSMPLDEFKEPDKLKHNDSTWNLRSSAIDNADVVFGWLELNELFSTIAELAYAAGKGKLVRLALADEVGRLGPNDNERLFPHALRTFRMFGGVLDGCLSPRIAFGRLFNVPHSAMCNVRNQNAVYFIEDSMERIKIGFSNDPEKRLRDLQTGSSNNLRLIGSIPGGRHLEIKLQSDFAHLRLKDEWFHATQELRIFIERELNSPQRFV